MTTGSGNARIRLSGDKLFACFNGKAAKNMENGIITKEELIAYLHETLELVSPIKEAISTVICGEFTIGETLALANIMNALDDLKDNLTKLDNITLR